MVKEIIKRKDFEKLAKETLNLVDKICLEQGIISNEYLEYFKQVQKASVELSKNWNKEKFDDLISQNSQLSEESKKSISEYLGVLTIVQNAINNANFDIKRTKPDDRLEAYYKKVLRDKIAENKSEERQGVLNSVSEVIDELAAIKEKMVISFTHTMHPVIYHTIESRELEKQISDILGDRSLDQSSKIEQNEQALSGFVECLKNGTKSITPQRKITLAEENQIEMTNLQQINNFTRDVMEFNNSGVLKVAELYPELKDQIISKLSIDEKFIEDTFQIRTWGRGADADGRERATALFVASCIAERSNDFEADYNGPILDPRQNISVFSNAINALVQKRYRKSEGFEFIESDDGGKFREFADDFVSRAMIDTNSPLPESWSASQKLFLEMNDHQQNEFLKELIKSDFQLVDERIKKYSVEFLKQYKQIFDDFIETKKDYFEEVGTYPKSFEDLKKYNNNPSYDDMSFEFINFTKQKPIEIQVDGKKQTIHIELEDNGLYFRPDDQSIGHAYLRGFNKLGKDGKPLELTQLDRSNIMNLVKRLSLLENSIELFGDKIADRHQIANFGKEQDFYSCMLMFKEAGLIEIKDGRVEDVKLKIMPLLETKEDQDRYPDVLKDLMKDDLAKSYFQKAGMDIMIGFSDGAKSCGNFASEWNAYKTIQQLKQICDDNGIEARFFLGRGRGHNRGGSIEAGTSQMLLPDNYTKNARYDVTIQADQPSHWAIASAYGQDQVTSTFIGTMEAAHEADYRNALKLKDREYSERMASYESVITDIANAAASVFEKKVLNNPDVGFFTDGTPVNPDISSRKVNRPESSGKTKPNGKDLYDNKRAVPIEASSEIASLGFHDVGLKSALHDFINSGKTIKNAEGEDVKGKEALSYLMEHPWFSQQLKRRFEGLQNVNFDIAKKYGDKIPDSNDFVQEVSSEISGLKTLLGNLVDPKNPYVAKNNIDGKKIAADSFVLSGDLKPKSEGVDTVRNFLFAVTQSVFNELSILGKYFEQQGGKSRG